MSRTKVVITFLFALSVALGMAGMALAHPDHGVIVSDGEGVVDSGKEIHGAHDHQHDGTDGHLDPTSENVSLIGKAPINQDSKEGRVADVGVFGDYAYLAAFRDPNCQKGGVYVMDISDPTSPKQINFIRTSNDSYVGEGVQVIHIDTPKYNGDVLAMNNEICGAPNQHSNGGMTLVDVTNPKVHKYLAEHAGDNTTDGEANPNGQVNQIHSVFMWDAGDKAYAVLVDDMETKDVDIMDITNPRNPKLIAEYDLAEKFPQILQEDVGLDSVFHHDMVVKRIGDRWIMLVSYWDGGYVTLDVTDPVNAQYIADSDFAFPDPEAAESGLNVDPEGNAHESEFTADNQYIVAADEDFNPYKTVTTNITDGTEFTAVRGDAVPGVPQGEAIEGETVYVGRACPGDPAVPAATGPDQIAVVERGVCAFQEKFDAVAAAGAAAGGYKAILVFNRENGAAKDGCNTLITMLVSGDIPTFFVTREDGFDFFNVPYDHAACEAGDGTKTAPVSVGEIGDDVRLESMFDGWGYVHLYRNGGGKLEELDTYAIPETHDPAYAQNFGDLSVHEAAVSEKQSDLAYFSYYAGGFRVARIVNDNLVEVGRFIDDGGNNFWGVQVFQEGNKEYVAASDRDYGLYIFKYTGSN